MYSLRELSVTEARQRFTQILNGITAGGEKELVFLIRRRGEPVAVIMSAREWERCRDCRGEEACARENGPADDSGAAQETPDAGEVPAEQEQVPEEVTNKLAEAIVREEACAQENAPADDSGAAQETPEEVGELPAEQEEMPEEAMNHIRDRVHESLLRGIPCNTVVRALVESYSTLGITNTVAEAIVREEACAQENAGELPAEQAESPGDRSESATVDQEARQPPLPEGANLTLPEGLDPPESYALRYLSEGYSPGEVFGGLKENYGLTAEEAGRIVVDIVDGRETG